MQRFSALALLLIGINVLSGRPVRAQAAGPYAQQLANESDELLRRVIRRPYGWAWDHEAAGEANFRPSPRAISIAPMATPAAGLVLLWTGKLLHQSGYLHAAEEVARGLAAAELPIGRVRSNAVFGPAVGGRETLFAFPDRTATRCAMGLLLALVPEQESSTQNSEPAASTIIDPHTEMLRAAAARAAHWLARQESPNGLWPSTFPAGQSTPHTIHLVRLDDADFRDSTLGLLLSFAVLRDETLGRYTTGPIDGLLKLRLTSDVHGPGLWCTACTPAATDIPTGFPTGPDLLASRFAMQTVLGGFLLAGNHDCAAALDQAAKTLLQVKRPGELYDRFLNPTAAADVARSLGDEIPATQQFFGNPTSQPQDSASGGAQAKPTNSVLADPAQSGSFGIPEVISANAKIQSIGIDHYIASMAAGIPVHDQIEAALCGLIDDPLTFDFPKTAAEVPVYLSAHADLWKITDGPAPDNLPSRVQRLWVLYLRARLEQIISAKNS